MPDLSILLINLLLIFVLTALLWLISLALRDASIVDPFWGTGFVVLAWSAYWQTGNHSWRSTLALALVTLWGLRLSVYLLFRNWGKGEDRRYQAMRERRGQSFWWTSLGTVFLLQGFLIWLVGMPVQVMAASTSDPGPFGILDAIAIAIFSIGLFFESVGDWQLSRFKADPANRGKVMDRGLWRYTRHPNYFGDFCVWWGLYLLAAADGAWWTIFSPVVMSFFLLRVSGVTLLEKDIEERRPQYRRYQDTTSAFFPWPPKNTEPATDAS